jgi:hypothetical protein
MFQKRFMIIKHFKCHGGLASWVGFWIRMWGDTYGGVRVLTFEAFSFHEGRLNQCSPLAFGAACPLVLVFNS